MIKIIALFFALAFLIACSSSHQNFIPKINDRVIRDDNKNEISIITFNIQALWGMDDTKVESLAKYLNENKFGFVAMQEVFDEDARDKLVENIDSSIYKSMIQRIDYDSFPDNIFQDAGLLLASRFPKVDLSEYNFGNDTEFSNGAIHQMLPKYASLSFDFLANKSIAGSLYQINDSTRLFLFTTHLQLFSSVYHKASQVIQIRSFITNAVSKIVENHIVNSPNNLIVLLTGDFNYNAYKKEDVEILKKLLGNPRDLHQEFNGDLHEYTKIVEWIGLYGRFDYIFAYDRIGAVQMRKVHINSINVTDVIDSEKESVSDHYAIIAELKIE